MSNLPGDRTDSWMKSGASATAAIPIGTLTNMTQRQDAQLVSIPPAISPMEAPTMETAA